MAMCSTAGRREEAAGRRSLHRSGPGEWMPHFSLAAQPSLQVVEGTEEHPATLEEKLMGASASQETCRPVVESICICPCCWALSWERLPLPAGFGRCHEDGGMNG